MANPGHDLHNQDVPDDAFLLCNAAGAIPGWKLVEPAPFLAETRLDHRAIRARDDKLDDPEVRHGRRTVTAPHGATLPANSQSPTFEKARRRDGDPPLESEPAVEPPS